MHRNIVKKPVGNFTMVPNHVIEMMGDGDGRLSPVAFACLCWVMSKPDGYSFGVEQVQLAVGIGRRAWWRASAELRDVSVGAVVASTGGASGGERLEWSWPVPPEPGEALAAVVDKARSYQNRSTAFGSDSATKKHPKGYEKAPLNKRDKILRRKSPRKTVDKSGGDA